MKVSDYDALLAGAQRSVDIGKEYAISYGTERVFRTNVGTLENEVRMPTKIEWATETWDEMPGRGEP